jgi:protein transport protein SEC24
MPGGGYPGAQRLVEQFESLQIGGGGPPAGPGMHGQQQQPQVPDSDPGAWPRPCGPDRARALSPPVPPFDPGNCHPDNMSATCWALPASAALRARWHLPLGVVVQPMADDAKGRAVPVIPLASHGIVRCRRCRTYMNPFVQWADGGRRFRCNVCGMANDVPVEYFSSLDQNGRRRDADERPELSRGTVEWVAPAEYMVRPPMPPVFFFAIDVSAPSVAAGLVGAAAQAIKACLDELPGDDRTLVGFLTFDTSLHFYSLRPSLSAPQMLVVAELDDPFLPLPEDLLVNLRDSRALADQLLDSLGEMFAAPGVGGGGGGGGGARRPPEPGSATGPALQAAFMAMSHVGGKLLLFQGSPPSCGAGRVKAGRDNPALYGTDREPSLRAPDDPFFKRFAAEASRYQITLDVFACAAAPADLASLAAVPRYTCGSLRHFPGFVAARDAARLGAEVRRNLTRPTAWEAVMRVRCSKGLRVSSFHGHFFNRSTDLLALPTCDPDKGFAVQVAHEEAVVPGPVAYVQCALLYTSSNGERRIRVHSMALPVTNDLSEMYRHADPGATLSLLAKTAVERALTSRLDETRRALEGRVAASLREYRLLHAAAARNPGALVYPSSLRLLPALALGLLKHAALRGGREVPSDERAAAAHALMEAPQAETARQSYPDVYALHDSGALWGTPAAPGGGGGKQQPPPPGGAQANGNGHAPDAQPPSLGGVVLPPTVPASAAYLSERGLYLIDNGLLLVLWVGRAADGRQLGDLLGPEAAAGGADVSSVPVEPARAGSALSGRLCALLGALRASRGAHPPCFALRQGTPFEAVVAPSLVEDRAPGAMAYGDWLQQLQRAVMTSGGGAAPGGGMMMGGGVGGGGGYK